MVEHRRCLIDDGRTSMGRLNPSPKVRWVMEDGSKFTDWLKSGLRERWMMDVGSELRG